MGHYSTKGIATTNGSNTNGRQSHQKSYKRNMNTNGSAGLSPHANAREERSTRYQSNPAKFVKLSKGAVAAGRG